MYHETVPIPSSKCRLNMTQSPKTYVNLPADSNAKSGNASLSALYFNNASSTILATSCKKQI